MKTVARSEVAKETVAWVATKQKATPCNGNASCYKADEPRETKKMATEQATRTDYRTAQSIQQ